MNYRPALAALAAIFLLSGCVSLTPARYIVSADAKQALQAYAGKKIKVASITTEVKFDPGCRAAGPLAIADGLSVPQFVEKAFNDELKHAGLHSEAGIALTGELTKIAFSSTAAVVNGWWELGLVLRSPNGKSMDVEVHHDFDAGFAALTACNHTGQALGTATEALIRKTVADPRFTTLLQ